MQRNNPVEGRGAWGSARILLIEDDNRIRDIVASSLQSIGWDCTSVGSGEDALTAFARGPFDLVLLDLGLPGISGIDVLRQIRSRSDVPVLVMTAAGGLDDRVAGFDFVRMTTQ